MRRIFYLSAAILCWLGSSVLRAAQAPVSSSTPQSSSQAQEEHPFYEDTLYPAWSKLTPARAEADIRAAISLARERQARISSIAPQDATYDNVFAAYESMNTELERAETLVSHLSSVMDNEELRAVQEKLIPELSAYSHSITSDEKLWHVIKTAAAAPWVKELSAEKQRFVQQVVDLFHDSGADLSAEQKERLAEISREISTLTHQFDKNVLDSANAWQWVVDDVSQLEGMSADWLARAAEAAREKGLGSDEQPCWLVTLDEPSARQVLLNCSIEASRQKCWEGMHSIGLTKPYDNAGIIARIMELRQEFASLLGFANYADLNLARRMAGSGAQAMAFIDEMMTKVKPAFDDEIKEIQNYISRCTGEPTEKIRPWDLSYFIRKLSKERFDFDPEELRPYQEYSHVLRGMFSIYQHLYDISISELPAFFPEEGQTCPEGSVEIWHPDVKVFAVYDRKTGSHLGSFYLDIFPRSTKRAGAWVLPLHYGKPAQGGKPHTPHLATIGGNLSPPTADRPALFSHSDVETLFHEFGHMMHVMLGDTELRSHCGTSVAWDFVELPSQMNENWTWEPEGIATYATHYENDAAISPEMLRKLQSLRFSFPALDNMGQLCLAKLDMEMHMNYAEKFKGKNIDDATHELLAPWKAPLSERAPSVMRNLTHCISGGYAAGYYSYKWAEVLAADVFTRFEKEGIMNATTGAEYRRTILSKGDSKPAGELYRDFMGRAPNPDALLQKQGLLPAHPEK